MYSRLLTARNNKSFFLFGPRGVGKTSWIRSEIAGALHFDLLDSEVQTNFMASPRRLGEMIPDSFKGWVIIDEVQKVPGLLDEVHRLIESRKCKFILTGSSARKLRRKGVNLLAGRALTKFMHPFVAEELGADFDLRKALQYGCLPAIYNEDDPKGYLKSYISSYLKEEVQQEGLTRNIGAFVRFLEAASFSQASVLNMANVARECGVEKKVVEDYFTILEDLLLAVRIPVFVRKAKRKLTAHPKFFLFDAGVFNAIRPRGPLDSDSEIAGAALETLFFQQLRAVNDYFDLGYSFHYWRTASKVEVDFVIYGERGLKAFEIKHSSRVTNQDLMGLKLFKEDYPDSQAYLLYGGNREWHESGVEVCSFQKFITNIRKFV